jgi:hypothetical protein
MVIIFNNNITLTYIINGPLDHHFYSPVIDGIWKSRVTFFKLKIKNLNLLNFFLKKN